jgi:hypothetical protein
MTDWFYEKSGNRIGPLPVSAMLSLHGTGEIHDNTLVWNKAFAANWRPYSTSGIAGENNDAPPALPSTHVNSTFAWIFALVPLIGLFIERLLDNSVANFKTDSPAVIIAYCAAYIALGYLDARQVERSGRNKKSVALKTLVWLAPAYLIQRARALGQKQLLFGVWLVAFVAAIAIEQPELMKGTVYLGFGLPACNSGTSVNQVKTIFDDIPLVKNAGVTALAVSDAAEVSKLDTTRTCRATVSMTNGNTVTVSYVISDKDDNYYYQVQISQ